MDLKKLTKQEKKYLIELQRNYELENKNQKIYLKSPDQLIEIEETDEIKINPYSLTYSIFIEN